MIESLGTLDEALREIVELDRVQVERREIFRIAELYLKTCDVETDSDYDTPLAWCVNQIAYDAVSKSEYIHRADELLCKAWSYIRELHRAGNPKILTEIAEFLEGSDTSWQITTPAPEWTDKDQEMMEQRARSLGSEV